MKVKFKNQRKGGKREGYDPRYWDGEWTAYRRGIYKCWYLYVLYLVKSKGDKKGIYANWRLKNNENFDIWWKNNWKRLFSQGVIGNAKIVQSIPKKKNDEIVYLEVPINAPESILLSQIKDLLHSEFVKRKLDGKYLYHQDLPYKMEVGRNFNTTIWLIRLDCIRLQDEGNTRLEIGNKLKIGDGESDACLRQVSRHIQLGKKLLQRVEKGRFNTSFLKKLKK